MCSDKSKVNDNINNNDNNGAQQLYLQKVHWRMLQAAQTALPQGWQALQRLGKALPAMTWQHCAEQTGLKSPHHWKLLLLLRLIGYPGLQIVQIHLIMHSSKP